MSEVREKRRALTDAHGAQKHSKAPVARSNRRSQVPKRCAAASAAARRWAGQPRQARKNGRRGLNSQKNARAPPLGVLLPWRSPARTNGRVPAKTQGEN